MVYGIEIPYSTLAKWYLSILHMVSQYHMHGVWYADTIQQLLHMVFQYHLYGVWFFNTILLPSYIYEEYHLPSHRVRHVSTFLHFIAGLVQGKDVFPYLHCQGTCEAAPGDISNK